MSAGKTLYGDEVSGAIVPEPEDDFLDELARAALQGRRINLEAIFARENEDATRTLGSSLVANEVDPAAASPVLAVVRRPLAEVQPVDPAAYSQSRLW